MDKSIKVKKEKLIKELKEQYKKLSKIYFEIFEEKYSNEENFKKIINKEYEDNYIVDKDKFRWNEKFCNKAAYILINKILFVKICIDRKFISINVDQNNIEVYKKSNFNIDNFMHYAIEYSLTELYCLAFQGGKFLYENIREAEEDKYELIIPIRRLLHKNFENEYQNIYLNKFETLVSHIVQILNKPEYFFGDNIEGNILGDVYERFLDKETRKSLGQFYTPRFIINYILKNTICKANIIENPFIRVLDPSCGSGNFLVAAYDKLREMFIEKLPELRKQYGEKEYEIFKDMKIIKIKGIMYWRKENLHYHLLKHCIFGADIDAFAVKLTTMGLLFKDLNIIPDTLNIIQGDSLIKWEEDYELIDLEKQLNAKDIKSNNIHKSEFNNSMERKNEEADVRFIIRHKNSQGIYCEQIFDRYAAEKLVEKCTFWSLKYDYIIGNPPYVGHKQLSMGYKKWLQINYSEVFRDKSDISFCFFKRNLDRIKETGIVALITSRYFMESPTGKGLRKYLKEKSQIISILDFYGAEIFKGVGVATAIFFYSKKKTDLNNINIYKLKQDSYDFEAVNDISNILDNNIFEQFSLSQNMLKEERWILISKTKNNILKKIENICKFQLGEIVTSFQGIITGCDKAFVLNEEETERLKIETYLLRNWIKNSNISRYTVKESNLQLIYSDLISHKEEYANSLSYISKYKERLESRRECKKGIRKWYELQWGRDLKLFENHKIVYPYKATYNKFAIDKSNCLCSADVYSFIVKDKYIKEYPLEYLLGILNSKTYEFYFKIFAKKMGSGIYDYYPNSVMSLRIPEYKLCEKIQEKTNELVEFISKVQKLENEKKVCEKKSLKENEIIKKRIDEIEDKIRNLENEVDKILQAAFGFSEDEIMLIEAEIKNCNLNLSI